MQPKVSVVMPVHNAMPHLPRAVDSILAQRNVELELVCVDDGSTDDSRSYLRRRAGGDPRLVLIKQPHQGIVAALNKGLEAARHPLLARMDADDVSHPDRLHQQADLLLSSDRLGVVGCLVRSFPRSAVGEGFRLYEDWLNSIIWPRSIAREVYVESPICHPSAMMRTHQIEELGGYRDKAWSEDYDLWLRYHQAGFEMAKVARYLFAWRMHPGRLSFNDKRCRPESFFRCKAHFLSWDHRVQRAPVLIWGAGIAGKRLSRHLLDHGIDIEAFVDIDPQKIGRTRRGRPVISPEESVRHSGSLILVAVGARNARPLIRQQLSALGRTESVDYIICS